MVTDLSLMTLSRLTVAEGSNYCPYWWRVYLNLHFT